MLALFREGRGCATIARGPDRGLALPARPLQPRELLEQASPLCRRASSARSSRSTTTAPAIPSPSSGLINKLRRYESQVSDLRGWQESIEAIVSRLWPMAVGVMGKALNRSYDTFKLDDFFRARPAHHRPLPSSR